MREREIAESIMGTLRDDDRPLRDRLYAVLTGALLAVGPPWPEDTEAYRLLGEVDQLMRQARAATPRPSRCTGEPWRSTRRRSGRSTLKSPRASTTWPHCTGPAPRRSG